MSITLPELAVTGLSEADLKIAAIFVKESSGDQSVIDNTRTKSSKALFTFETSKFGSYIITKNPDGAVATLAVSSSTFTTLPITVTLTLSEEVEEFVASMLTIKNGVAGTISGSGTSYSFDVTPDDSGEIVVSLAAETLTNLESIPNAAGASVSFTYADPTNPTLVLASTSSATTNLTNIPVTATFSRSVTGFTSSDVTIFGGTIGSFTGSGKNYSFYVTPSGSSITIDVAAGVATSTTNIGNLAATQLARTFDNTVPTVVLTTSAGASSNVSPIPVTATFSESVTGFVIEDITVTNGAASNFAGSGAVYTFDVTPSAQGNVVVSVAAANAVDAALNPNTASNNLTVNYDTVAPTAPTVSGTALVTTATPTWTWTAGTGGNGTFRYKIDSSDLTSGATETTALTLTSGSLTEGTHILYVQERDAAGNWSTSGSFSTVSDLNAPSATSTVITTSAVTYGSMTLTWTKATDTISAQSALTYRVYQSTSPITASVAGVEAATALNTATADINTINVTGLDPAVTYYFNLVVTDVAGQKSVYTTKSQVTNAFCGGAGTIGSPYQVCTLLTLNQVRNYLSSYFIQTANIDASSTSGWNSAAGWDPIGTSGAPFTGTYDGGSFEISGLFINRSTTDDVGLFGHSTAGAISNLGVTTANVTGQDYTGALGGLLTSTLTNTWSSGTVSGRNGVGGLVGKSGNVNITTSRSSANVTAIHYSGGLIGWFVGTTSYKTISNSFATGSVNTTPSGREDGGLVGRAEYVNIDYCYAAGDVTGYGEIGGLVGTLYYGTSRIRGSFALGKVTASWAYAGGLVANSIGTKTIEASFTDTYIAGGGSMQGGLLGTNFNYNGAGVTNLQYAFSVGDMRSAGSSGGIIGISGGVTNILKNVFSLSTLSTGDGSGGLVGADASTTKLTIQDSFLGGDMIFPGGGATYHYGGVIYNAGGTATDIHRNFSSGMLLANGSYTSGLISVAETSSSRKSNFYFTNANQTPTNCHINNAAANLTSYNSNDCLNIAGSFSSPVGKLWNGAAYVSFDNDTVAGSKKVSATDKTSFMLRGRCYYPNTTIALSGAVSTTATCNAGRWSKTIDLTSAAGFAAAADGTSYTVTATLNGYSTNLSLTKETSYCETNSSTLASGFAGGAGTVGDPYTICSVAQLNNISGKLSSGTAQYFKLMTNLDLSSGFNGPIGHATSTTDCTATFCGDSFDGNGYAIKNFRSVTNTSNSYQGLFTQLRSGSTVTNLTLYQAMVSGPSYVGTLSGSIVASTVSNIVVSGNVASGNFGGGLSAVLGDGTGSTAAASNIKTYVNVASLSVAGGMVGYAVNHSGSAVQISSSSAYGHVVAASYAGGFVGFLYGEDDTVAPVSQCFAEGNVSAGYAAGGFVGSIANSIGVTRSYAKGHVTSGNFSGGFAGMIGSDDGNSGPQIVSNNYATGVVTGNTSGGFVGHLSSAGISKSYANNTVLAHYNGGGFVGYVYPNEDTYYTSLFNNVFASGSLYGSAAGYSAIGGFYGLLDGSQSSDITGSANHFYSHAGTQSTCGGTDNITSALTCADQTSESYFFSSGNGVYSTWDFSTIWNAPSNGVYPTLR
jgi:hypothetical protein